MNIKKECRSYSGCRIFDGSYSDCIGCPMSYDENKWYSVIYDTLENLVPEAPAAVIMNYKSKACEMVGNNCNKCEGAYKYNNKTICVFDTVNRFIEWYDKYKR